MQNKRLCTGEELKAMGRRHVDKVIDAIESGDMEQAKEHLYTALKAATQAAHVSTILDVLASIAQLAARMGHQKRAAELLAYVAQHPASSFQTHNNGERLLAELRSQLPPEAIAAANERNQDKTLEDVVDQLLEEMRDW